MTRVVNIEESIWSPAFGLKGKIDATVEVTIHRGRPRDPSFPVEEERLIVPLELKSGRPEVTNAHRAQVVLYALMMSDRYGT